HRAHVVGGDVAGDHQRGVVRRIETPVEGQRVVAIELFDFMVPADHRPAIGMVEIEGRHDLLGQPRFGLLATRMLYSSSTTSRSCSTLSSLRTSPVMRSASNSI